jgi:hypothetical protein
MFASVYSWASISHNPASMFAIAWTTGTRCRAPLQKVGGTAKHAPAGQVEAELETARLDVLWVRDGGRVA